MVEVLGIVIPTLNEAAMLPGCLASLSGCCPVLVADGGSTDGTVALASRHPLAPRVIVTAGGRDRQLTRALESLACDWVLVLPADGRLRAGAECRIARRCAELRGATACLDLIPDDGAWHHRLRRSWSRLRSRWTGGAYLDQAPLFRRAAAMQAGAFRPCGAYDSAELGWRLRQHGPLCVLPEPVLVSCRAYRSHGVVRTVIHHQRQRLRLVLGGALK